MKKTLLVLLSVVFSVFCLFAWQETFSSESAEYRETLALARIAGKETAIMVTPVTGEQLLNVLSSLPYEQFNKSEKALYDDLVDRLENPGMTLAWKDCGIKISPNVSAQAFVHTNKEAETDDWTLGRREYLPFIDLEGKVYFSENIFGMIDFDISKSPTKTGPDEYFFTNLKEALIGENTFPHKAGFSIGTKHLNLNIGRDTVSLGKGVVDNMVLGNSLWWQDFVKLSAFNGPFNYDMILMAFDADATFFDHNSARDLVAVHNFSFNTSWFSFALTEGMLQYGDNILEDLRILNPFFCLHNTNGFLCDNQNNFFGIEFGFTPIRGFEFTVQGIIDQIQISTELENGKPAANTAPNAYGILTNAKYSKVCDFGLINMYLEGAYTSPALYLKEKNEKYDYNNVDLIVGNKLWLGTGYDASYLGYKYGPDSIVVSTGAELSTFKDSRFYADLTYSIHGSHGIADRENQQDWNDVGPDYYYQVTPTNNSKTTAPEHRFVLQTGVEMNFLDSVCVVSEFAFVNVWNYHNNIGKSFTDFQLSLGAKVNLTDFVLHFIK